MKPTPVISGPHGDAWRFDHEAIRRKHPGPYAGVAGWLIHAPGYHPLWHSYAIDLIHLRPVEGLGEPKIYLPGATHEILLFALDPKWKMDLKSPPRRLEPQNFGAQFIAADDLMALLRVQTAVHDIVDGRLSPDTDFIHDWTDRFGDNMLKGGAQRADTMIERDGKTVVIGIGQGITKALNERLNTP